ncbi:hypothetical protein DB32_001365 [Sandaracinus amylolyticus]|uniref:Uncharacterized protein n=1 Tax=Sandaracinus amylolyticus TaxID=927083 RepID=A0A0F6YGQ8_9BACT|nr:hypothetical protein DB32_001365 [Sandaracinus amylolyticus]
MARCGVELGERRIAPSSRPWSVSPGLDPWRNAAIARLVEHHANVPTPD